MILKLGMKHQGEELYKVYINHDLGMTLTYFMARSTSVAHVFEWGKFVKCNLMGECCWEYANGQNSYVYENKYPQGVVCPSPWAIYMYMTTIFKHLLL